MTLCLTRHGHDFVRLLLSVFQGRMSSTSGCAGVFQIPGRVCTSKRYRHARADNLALPRRSKLCSPLWVQRKRHLCAIEDHTDCNCEGRKSRPALPFVLVKHSPKIIALFRDRRGWECIRLGLVCEGETQSSVICISDLTAPSLPRRRGGTGGVCTNWAEYLWSKYLWPRLVDAPSCYQDPTAIPAAIGTASRKILSSWWVLIA